MLPPKKRVLDREQAHPAGQLGEERLQHGGAELARHDHIAAPRRIRGIRRSRGGHRVRSSGGRRGREAGRAVTVGGSAVDPREEPRPRAGTGPVVPGERGAHLGLERARHADAVLVLRTLVVRPERRERTVREEVVLVGGVHEATTERVGETRLPTFDDVDDGLRFGERVLAHLVLVVVRAHPERHDPDGRKRREPVEDPEEGVVEHRAVVDAGAHDDLAVHLDARVEQQLQPAQARRAAADCAAAGSGRRGRSRGCSRRAGRVVHSPPARGPLR